VSGEIPPAIGDFPAGARIASYRIDQLIGRGGMATVYRATDVRLDRLVALKILTPQLARNDSFRQRFILESRAGASIDHPHVVPVFEAGEAQGVLFIAMRYVTGNDVRALIDREGRLSAARTVEIVSQVASALDAAHAHGLVHRDVKPANMLMSEISDGKSADYVYLSDFGLSKQSLASASLTGTGQFLGTLDYMSPEQIGGRPIDGRTDLYALGCATFEMLAGEPPFRREANLAVMWAQVSAPPPSLRQWRPDLPPAVDAVIAKALAKSPDDRQSSCTEFAQALRAACAVPSAGAGSTGNAWSQADQVPAGNPQLGPPTQRAFGQAAGAAAEATVSRLAPDGGQVPPSPPGYQGGDPGYQAGGAGYQAGGAGYQGGGAAYQAGLATTGPVPAASGGAYPPSAPGYVPGPSEPGYGGPGHGEPAYGGPGYGPTGPGYGPTGPGYGPGGPTYGASGPGAGEVLPSPGGPGGFGYPPAAPPQPPRRGKAVPILMGFLIVVILVAAGFTVLHLRDSGNPQADRRHTKVVTTHRSTTTSPPKSSSPTPSQSGNSSSPTPSQASASPAATVQAYYQDVNNHQYSKAWQINPSAHSLSDFSTYEAGFDGTKDVALTIDGVSGDDVSVSFIAYQTDGSQKDYSGTYTVENGKIISADIGQTN
jgi:tRNA A-37 threonylcarbamoyl transferase component Bud32